MIWFKKKSKNLVPEYLPEVFIFHKVTNNISSCYGVEKKLSISRNDFEQFIINISKKNTPIKLSDFINNFDENRDYSDYFIITFDDGYEDNYSVAYPILEKYKIPFTIFVTTSLINKINVPYEFVLSELLIKEKLKFNINYGHDIQSGEDYYEAIRKKQKNNAYFLSSQLKGRDLRLFTEIRQDILNRELFLSWNQLKTMRTVSKIDIGGHNNDHLGLNSLPHKESIRQIVNCLDEIDERLDMMTFLYSYPYGDFSQIHLNFVTKLKRLKASLSTMNKFKDSLYNIKRKEVESIFELKV